jgi:hypothetical protein
MLFVILTSRKYKQLKAIAPNEPVVCGYSDDGHFLGACVFRGYWRRYAGGVCQRRPLSTIHKDRMYSPLGVGDAFNNLPNGHIMRGVNVSTEGKGKGKGKVLDVSTEGKGKVLGGQ